MSEMPDNNHEVHQKAKEQIEHTELDRAREFLETHVYAPNDYEEYTETQIKAWKSITLEAIDKGEPIQPFWVRRNGDSYTQFAAHVDYFIYTKSGLRSLAGIDINSDGGHSEVEVWLAKNDGSGEPEVKFQEAYTLESLARALKFAEESVDQLRTPPKT